MNNASNNVSGNQNTNANNNQGSSKPGSSDGSKGSGSHKYRYLSKKGSGAFSDVIKAQCVKNNNLVAIKRMKAVFKSVEQITGLREVQALRKLSDHPNIIKLLEILYDRNSGRLALVFELMDMNLFELIKGRRIHLPEARIKMYMYQMLLALEASHRMGIFHRDIKPENVLITENVLKLGDFGSCRGIFTQQPFTEYISTRWYRPPECLLTDGYYSAEMDIFATGCVMFEVYALFPLFPGKDELDQINKIHAILGTPPRELLARIRKGTKNNPIKCDFLPQQGTGFARLIPHASKEAIDLIDSMIQYDPKRRITAAGALKHPYFNGVALVDTTSNQVIGYLNQKDGTIVKSPEAALNSESSVTTNNMDVFVQNNSSSHHHGSNSVGNNAKEIDVEGLNTSLKVGNANLPNKIGTKTINNGSENPLVVAQDNLQKQQMYGARPSKTPPNAKRVNHQQIAKQINGSNNNIGSSSNIYNNHINNNNMKIGISGKQIYGNSNNNIINPNASTKILDSNASLLHVNQTVVEHVSRECSSPNGSINKNELTLPSINHHINGTQNMVNNTSNNTPMVLPMLNANGNMSNETNQVPSSNNILGVTQKQKSMHKITNMATINNGTNQQRNVFTNNMGAVQNNNNNIAMGPMGSNQPIKGTQYIGSTKYKKNVVNNTNGGQMYINYSNQSIPVHQRVGMNVKYGNVGSNGMTVNTYNTNKIYGANKGTNSKAKLPGIY